MIVITGAAGFIASNLAAKLNAEGFKDLVLVDDFSREDKKRNWENLSYTALVHRNDLEEWIQTNQLWIQFVVHLGARTDTTEFRKEIFDTLNVNYSKMVWNACVRYGIPLIYASSAATYGMGELGYRDDHTVVNKLKPLNPYGESKNEFDQWVLSQAKTPFFWAGLKFFNVYGQNEYHKSRMASVVYHSFLQITKTGKMKLFRSHHPDFKDGEQLRDFIYVNDVVDVIYYLMQVRKESGLYNLGTGIARSFLDLSKAVFHSLNLEPVIEFIDTPADIRNKYQYYTCASMEKLRKAGYHNEFHSLEAGVKLYVEELKKAVL
jgi:ADP-L-glycero-D-manno-heptose 6-epimerase